MTNALTIPFDYNNWEYYEFVWRFERLVEERQRENAERNSSEGRMAMSNLGVNMGQLNSQNGE